jgi:hypothetical protein
LLIIRPVDEGDVLEEEGQLASGAHAADASSHHHRVPLPRRVPYNDKKVGLNYLPSTPTLMLFINFLYFCFVFFSFLLKKKI